MYLWSSLAKSYECAVLTAACAVSMRMPPSSRRLRAMDGAPSRGLASEPANSSCVRVENLSRLIELHLRFTLGALYTVL
jgi:hypothetical protein